MKAKSTEKKFPEASASRGKMPRSAKSELCLPKTINKMIAKKRASLGKKTKFSFTIEHDPFFSLKNRSILMLEIMVEGQSKLSLIILPPFGKDKTRLANIDFTQFIWQKAPSKILKIKSA